MDENSKNTKPPLALKEEEILKFWEENKVFEKTLDKNSKAGIFSGRKDFVFYEGPPTANGKPGIHHLEARAFKDAIPRYKTMQGFYVRRKGGWDTHGLPVELQVEKQLGLKSKKDIEEYGVAEFNKKCKESVWQYIDLWNSFTKRIGYWVDGDNPYVTYHNSYIESVWSILKKVEDKKLLYKDYKVVPWCPRCGTALSSHELAQGYENVKDLSVYTKFKIINENFKDKYLLAWTTTPWTLLGNVALAVGNDIEYVEAKLDGEILILAKERLSVLEKEYEIIATHKGSEIVGLEYEPLYPFIKENCKGEGLDRAYKVYSADFVNTEDGTGIVHTAVMYGQDDFVLGTEMGLPKFHTVDDSGHFVKGTGFLEGRFVKDEETTVEIIKDLAHRNLLFKKEKYEHSYPHCWRCKTPLIYYARDSWYIKMSELREKLVKENEKINWEPDYIKEGRFGEWLREIKDWAISRERYWGTPLPIWQNKEGKKVVIGSIEELKKHTKKSGNKYFAMRHGEAEQNISGIINSDLKNVFHLTEKGKDQVLQAGDKLKGKNITKIFSSPFDRCKETAFIVAEKLGIKKEDVKIDNRLFELRAGDQNEGKLWSDYVKNFKDTKDRFINAPEGGESLYDLSRRVGEFIYELESKYSNENILIVSHEAPVTGLHTVVKGADIEEAVKIKDKKPYGFGYAEISELDFAPLPHNENYELDLHKPYIDEVKLIDENGDELIRVKEVLDVWFDSGAMPFAQDGLGGKEMQYPADYISEAIDQTRGWFYTLHAVGVLMDKGFAYKNVICLGHILDEKGKKMSKSVGNIVDPWVMIEKYGVDALRFWMYSVNQPGESKNFDERSVDEIVKKVFNMISNILVLYYLYKTEETKPNRESKNVLDKWIISRLDELVGKGTEYLDNFKLFEATRLIKDFVNDFSTWYIRRSRDRFKSDNERDKHDALSTTLFVLKELSKYMAPFTPFFAEDVYRSLRTEDDPISVHLTDWPKAGEVDKEVLEDMEEVRRVVSLALEKRNTAGIKVRQPLSKLKIKNAKLKNKKEYTDLIRDEVNVKEIIFDEKIEAEGELDTNITEELKKEGDIREFVRAVQELRKENSLTPDQKITIRIETDEAGKSFIESAKTEISKPTNVSEFVFEDNQGAPVKIGEMKFNISVS